MRTARVLKYSSSDTSRTLNSKLAAAPQHCKSLDGGPACSLRINLSIIPNHCTENRQALFDIDGPSILRLDSGQCLDDRRGSFELAQPLQSILLGPMNHDYALQRRSPLTDVRLGLSSLISPTHKRTEGRVPVWGSEFTSKNATLQGGDSAETAAGLDVKLWTVVRGCLPGVRGLPTIYPNALFESI